VNLDDEAAPAGLEARLEYRRSLSPPETMARIEQDGAIRRRRRNGGRSGTGRSGRLQEGCKRDQRPER